MEVSDHPAARQRRDLALGPPLVSAAACRAENAQIPGARVEGGDRAVVQHWQRGRDVLARRQRPRRPVRAGHAGVSCLHFWRALFLAPPAAVHGDGLTEASVTRPGPPITGRARTGIRLPHVRLTCPFLLSRSRCRAAPASSPQVPHRPHSLSGPARWPPSGSADADALNFARASRVLVLFWPPARPWDGRPPGSALTHSDANESPGPKRPGAFVMMELRRIRW